MAATFAICIGILLVIHTIMGMSRPTRAIAQMFYMLGGYAIPYFAVMFIIIIFFPALFVIP